MTDTGLHSGARPNSPRKATSAWLALLAATLLIAPHGADLQALAAPAAPEPRDIPQPPDTQQTPAPTTQKYSLGTPRTVIVAGGEYADFPGRAGHGYAPRAWLCPDAALYLPPDWEAGHLVGSSAPRAANTLVARLLDRGPPA